jgi:hypothetical protein
MAVCVRGERLVECRAGALEDDHLRGCSASAWHESIAESSGSMLLVRHPRESTGQIAYLWLKWTLKEKDPELTSARECSLSVPISQGGVARNRP